MKIINVFRYNKRCILLNFLSHFAIFFTVLCILCSTSYVNARVVDTPYGPVDGVDFGLYGDEEFAERSAEEYDTQEAGAGVVTDLVFTLTEENMKKKKLKQLPFKEIFKHFCGPCHGETGKGDGKNFASVLEPMPRDLTDADYMSELGDDHVVRVITGGTASVEKSNLCPPWGNTFSEDRINRLAVYVRSLSLVPEEKAVAEEAASEEKVAAGEERKGGIVGTIVRLSILALVCGFVIAGALNEWKIISWWKRK